MSKYLQVRVTAQTVDPSAIEDAWPILFKLAYPPANEYAAAKKGVLELIHTLGARLSAGDIPEKAASVLRGPVAQANTLTQELEEALASWRPDKAREITERIEDALDDLEAKARYS